MHRTDMEFLQEVLIAVADGSGKRSPFFHLSRIPRGAFRYSCAGQDRRGEKAEDQIFTKVNLREMIDDGVITIHDLLDISNEQAFKYIVQASTGYPFYAR